MQNNILLSYYSKAVNIFLILTVLMLFACNNENSKQTTIDSLKTQLLKYEEQATIDSLKKQLSKYEKNKTQVNTEEIDKEIKRFLAGIDFHEPTCDKYIKQTQNKDLTKKLNAFKEICKQVENANSIIKEENKDSEFIKSTMLHISVFINMEENYRKIRNVNSISKYYTIILKKDKNYEKVYSETELAKYIFLNNTQRKELVLYWDVLNNARLAFDKKIGLNEKIQSFKNKDRSQELFSLINKINDIN